MNQFNILCSTSRPPPHLTGLESHLPASGVVTLEGDIDLVRLKARVVSEVEFNGRKYPFLSIGSKEFVRGSVVITLDEGFGSTLDLYTDTPIAGSGETTASLRTNAKHAMERAEVAQAERSRRWFSK